MKGPEIFLSYSWTNKSVADKIYYDLTFVGFDVIKDDHTLKYTDNIPSFIDKIKKADYALLLISDAYLKSISCMTEAMQLDLNDESWKKVLPVISNDARFYEILDRMHYVTYWQAKSDAIESALKSIDPTNATTLFQELKSFKGITQNINLFLTFLKEHLNVTTDKLFEEFYAQVIKKIGTPANLAKMTKLVPISFIPDPKKRLVAINNFIKKYKVENPYCFSIKASCYRDLRQSKKAIEFYKKAIELDDLNFTAWNNLGQVYELMSCNYFEAKKAYEKAIRSKPNLDIPRLNLGVLLSTYFKDTQGAKIQYEEILKFDENNPRAHNNLANIYKAPAYLDLDKAEKHLIIAVNQNNLEATIGYANFLKAFRNETDLGNSFYRRAKELDTENMYTEVIDFMMKAKKG